MAPPPHSLSEHLFASSHHPLPPSPSVCVCVCKRRELDLTLPALGKRTYCTAPHSDQSYDGTWSEVRTICVLQHLAFFAAEPCVMSLSLSALSPLSIISLSLAESQNLGLGLLSLCGVCVECVKCVECVFVHGNSGVGGLYHSCGIMTVRILCIFYPHNRVRVLEYMNTLA